MQNSSEENKRCDIRQLHASGNGQSIEICGIGTRGRRGGDMRGKEDESQAARIAEHVVCIEKKYTQ